MDKIADLEGPRIVYSNGLGHVPLGFVRLALALKYQLIVILKTKAAKPAKNKKAQFELSVTIRPGAVANGGEGFCDLNFARLSSRRPGLSHG